MARRGYMLMEMIVACAILGVLLTVSLQLLAGLAAQRHAADQRQLAAIEIGNVMDRVASRRWAELTQASVARETLAESVRRQLPGAELKIEISIVPQEPEVKRILVSLRWRDRTGQPLPPVQVVTWKNRKTEKSGQWAVASGQKNAVRQLSTDHRPLSTSSLAPSP